MNDGGDRHTGDNLRQLRADVNSDRVVWMLPGLNPRVRAVISAVAAEHGDRVVDSKPYAGADRLHPNGQGYARLARVVGGSS